MSGAWLFWGLIFGAIGLGMLVYGRKQKVITPVVCGLALMCFPYFVSNLYALVAIGIGLIVTTYYLRN